MRCRGAGGSRLGTGGIAGPNAGEVTPFSGHVLHLFPATSFPSRFSQLYLLAFCSLEVNVAVALPAFGRGAELPQPVSLGSLGQANVSEGPRRSRHLWGHPVDAYEQKAKNRSCTLAAEEVPSAKLEQKGLCHTADDQLGAPVR